MDERTLLPHAQPEMRSAVYRTQPGSVRAGVGRDDVRLEQRANCGDVLAQPLDLNLQNSDLLLDLADAFVKCA